MFVRLVGLRLVGLHQDRRQLRHLVRRKDALLPKFLRRQITQPIIDHLFAHRLAQGLGQTALHLAAGGDWVDDHAAVHGHDPLLHGDLGILGGV